MTWQRPQFDDRDFDPHLQGPYGQALAQQRSRHALREGFEQGGLGDGAIQLRKYVEPDGELFHWVESIREPGRKYRIPSTYPGTFTPGQFVKVSVNRQGEVLDGHPPQGARNVSERPARGRSGTVDLLSVTKGTPFEVQRGTSTDVSLEGIGFRESPIDTFEPRKYDPSDPDADDEGWAPFDGVTFSGITWVSATQVDLTVSVSSTVPDGSLVAVYYARS